MPILTKEVEVMPMGKAIQHYKDKGYDVKHKQLLIVSVDDLPKGSDAKVEVLCDMCHKNQMMVKYNNYNRIIKNTGSYVCRECASQKRRKTNQKRYGTSFPIQLELFKEKREQTYLERYGVTNYAQTKECLEKMKQTCVEKYGVEYSSQFPATKEKTKQTNLERYGAEYPAQTEEVKEKLRNTLQERYGVDSPMKLPMFKEKLVKKMYQNGTQRTSRQQFYLQQLYGGELNYPIKYYDVDICFPDENFIIEYDGSGHNLSVKFGDYTQEEFNQREVIRSNILKREGYKQMRIISRYDKLPYDNILFQMLKEAKQYFSTTNHSWIYYDIDNSKMINAENKKTNGVFYDYGNLRTIKEIA